MRSRPSRYRHRLLASATLLALGPALAQAQASGTASAPPAPSPAASAPETVLPVIRATATGVKETATSPVPGYVARRSATATKTDTPLKEVPQSVTVITADQVKDQGSANLQEALRYSAGVRHEVYGIDNRGDWFGLRGSEESTLLLDGMRQPLSGWWGIVRTEPYAHERIEVLRGPSSIIAGANDPGGVVNLVSKRPQPLAAREIGVVLGSHAHKELQADLTGPIDRDGRWLYRVVALGRDTGTQVRHAEEERTLLAPSLTWRPRNGDTVTVYAEHQRDRSGNTNAFLGLAGTLQDAPHGRIPSDLFIGEPAWDRYGGTRRRAGWSIDLGLNDTWRLRQQLRHDRVDGVMKSMYAAWWDGFVDASGAADPDGRHMNRLYYVYDDKVRITTAEALLEGRLRTGGMAHTLLFGIDGVRHDARQFSTEEAATPLNVYAPVYGSVPEPSLAAGAQPSDSRVRRFGVLVQDQVKLTDKVSVRAGLRRDTVRTTSVGSPAERASATSVNLGAVYEVLPGLSPYASYSESFNPVAGTDADGRAYRPKRGKQVELGLKWDRRPVQATVSVYALEEANRLMPDPQQVGRSVQIGKARVKGLEAELKADTAHWELLGSYTYTRARATADGWGGLLAAGEQLGSIPEHTASLWAVHRLGWLLPGLRAGAGVRHVGRVGDGTGAVFVPSVTLVDAMASYDTGPWRFALNVNNLTDKDYLATCLSRGDCWFGQRRKATLSASYRW
jgi:iron complex outermembrane receptor protein